MVAVRVCGVVAGGGGDGVLCGEGPDVEEATLRGIDGGGRWKDLSGIRTV